MASSSSRVFNIREIVALIFGFVDKPDCVRMCRVSRVAFHAASPFVWEHVEGVYNLLKLFPEAHMTELDFVQGSQYTLFEPDGQVLQPGRFNFYAPFVRRLNIYGKRAVRFGIRGWTYLMRLSTRQTLLPNLVSLDMTTSCKYGWDLALWVRLFASSSVVNVLLIPNPFETAVGISYPVAATILKYLIEHCPHLRNVCLFPDKEASHAEIYDSKGDSLAALLYDQPFHHYLLPTLGIRQLSCSLSVLENENLKALSQLPHLERLTVHAVDEVVESKHPLLPEGSFPSLQFLSLRSNYCGDLTWVLNIRSLLERITTLEVYCDISTNDDTISWTIHRFLPALAHGTVLENLAVDFNADELRDPDDWLLDLGGALDDSLMTALGPFRRLPLQKISISCMRFPIDPSLVDFGTIWPLVTHLELKDQRASCRVLPAFARLPRLEHLALQLVINMHLREEYITEPSMGTNLHTLEGTVGSKISCRMGDADKIVYYLLSLWPNLQRVIWPSEDSNEQEHAFVALLNQRLGA